jgi:hypothetical protein
MKKQEARRLAEYLGSAAFKSSKNGGAAIKVVQIRIALDPVAEAVRKAEETARGKFLTPELEQLAKLADERKLKEGSAEAHMYIALFNEFQANFAETLTPTYEAAVKDVKWPKLTRKEFDAILEANGGFTGDVLGLVVEHLVEVEEKEESVKEEV